MRTILKGRWIVLIAWILLTVGLLFAAPDMGELVREKGQLTVPDGYDSKLAAQILQEKSDESKLGYSIALVFHQENGITAKEEDEISAALHELAEDKQQLGVMGVLSHYFEPELAEQMVSEDHKTIIATVDIERGQKELSEVRTGIEDQLKGLSVEHYLTGDRLIDEDVIVSSENGLRKTEVITVIFIFAIIVLVFRSVVAPLIPLLTVGFSYLVSQSIVAFLVDWYSFPLSNFTQIFLVAVLFGIGTDYCILLLSRFKEELSKGSDKATAILETYKTAGRTVLFSALAVFVGFSSLGLASFNLYQSAAGVAIGIVVLFIALVTLVPFFMYVMGKHIFWPSKRATEHQESKIWRATGSFSLARPFLALLLVGIIVIPLLISHSGGLSFNLLNEVGEEYDSVKGFNLIAESFGPGETLPVEIVLAHDRPLDNQAGLSIIERISREVAKVDNVEKVRSATRPLGDVMTDFQVSNQVEALEDGLSAGNEGIAQIRDGLALVNEELDRSAPEMAEATVGVEELIKGTAELQTGVQSLTDGMKQLEAGLSSGAIGMGELKSGLATLNQSSLQLQEGSQQLLQGYQEVGGGLTQLTAGYEQLEGQLAQIFQAIGGLQANIAQLQERYPALNQDQDFLVLVGTLSESLKGSEALLNAFQQANGSLAQVAAGVEEANKNFTQITQGQVAFNQGLGQFMTGLEQLHSGMLAAEAGQKELLAHMPALEEGVAQIGAGQKEIGQGFGELIDQLQALNDGLGQSVDGLTQISDGLAAAKLYLLDLAAGPDQEMTGWSIPQEALEHPDFQKVFENYMSKDRTLTTFDVILKTNPYEEDSLDTVALIKEAVQRGIASTDLEGAQIGIGGVSSIVNDLRMVSDADYTRTVIIMLAGVFLILIILLRSLTMPLYLIVSLIICYFTSISVTELIFVNFLGYEGINWAVPFFSFVILIALGVDYCIFLMDRFREYRDLPVEKGILTAMENMGTVIVSAVVILSGTFAAMLPSGVLSILQIATTILTGLLMYALLFLPFFIPVMVKLFGKGNWWPFKK